MSKDKLFFFSSVVKCMPTVSLCNSKLFPFSVKFTEIAHSVELLKLLFESVIVLTVGLHAASEIQLLGCILT